jgi:hypothetical protein
MPHAVTRPADGRPADAAHARGMAALDAFLAPSRELGLPAVAHRSRYRGTSRAHLRVFFGWSQDRPLGK